MEMESAIATEQYESNNFSKIDWTGVGSDVRRWGLKRTKILVAEEYSEGRNKREDDDFAEYFVLGIRKLSGCLHIARKIERKMRKAVTREV